MMSRLISRHLKQFSSVRKPVGYLLRSETINQASFILEHMSFNPSVVTVQSIKYSSKRGRSQDLNSLLNPVDIMPEKDLDGINVGEELTGGTLQKQELQKLLLEFYRKPQIKAECAENGLDNHLFISAFKSFRQFCKESEKLPVDMHIILSDIIHGAGNVTDLLPYFLQHAKRMYPHLDCMDDLCNISDLRQPPNWYPDARFKQRKIIYHAGPTNSGKTYHALQRFYAAKSGVYCGPLRMLATEVFEKTNTAGTECDLVTGEERRVAREDGGQASHVACTVEMTSIITPYEVGIIDEIQMIKDQSRGWAWTRAFLGLCTDELHVCGDGSALDLIHELSMDTGDTIEVRHYERLTKLTVQSKPVEKIEHIKAGDCIVCFSKQTIYQLSRQLENLGVQVAVIYGTLPASTKRAQAEKFNDPNDPCNVLVATDAIGMGLNLNIKRVIFHSLVKPTRNEKNEITNEVISASQALQIAGRAGRYGSQYEDGQVTTFNANDLIILKKLLNTPIAPVEQAGLNPTEEQMELFAYHLPKATLTNLIDIFINISQLDNSKYFMCEMEAFKFLASLIQHIPLPLKTRYVFCCAPVDKKQTFQCNMFLKFARQVSQEQVLTVEWLSSQIGWPFAPPTMLSNLQHLEEVFGVLDIYLWLSYRFPDMFPDTLAVHHMQKELDRFITHGVTNIIGLIKKQVQNTSSGKSEDAAEIELHKISSKDCGIPRHNQRTNGSKSNQTRKFSS